MPVKQVMMTRQTGTKGMPAVHSHCFINKSNKIIGIMKITHANTNVMMRAMRRMMNLVRRPIMRSEAERRARRGYNPGADTATRAIIDDDNR